MTSRSPGPGAGYGVQRRRRPDRRRPGRHLQFTTDGGDINGTGLTAPTLNAESGGGNVTVAFTKPPANLDITSDGGDVTVLLPQGAPAYNVKYHPRRRRQHRIRANHRSNTADTINVGSGGGNISIATKAEPG